MWLAKKPSMQALHKSQQNATLKNTKLLVIFRKTSQNVNENKLFLAVENLSIYVKVCEILKKKENNPIEGLDFEKRYIRFQSSWWPKSWKVVDN